MATRRLPIDSRSLDYTMTIELDETDYVFRLRWQERLSAWFMDILDVNRDPLLLSKRISTNTVLNRSIRTTLKGSLVAISSDDRDDSDPGESDLGNRVKLVYIEE